VPEVWRPILGLNPLAGVVEGFRWALLGTGANVGTLLAVSTLTATVLLASGLLYFTRMERTLADVL
jgi:lipopolysaccharide transport system permease protein